MISVGPDQTRGCMRAASNFSRACLPPPIGHVECRPPPSHRVAFTLQAMSRTGSCSGKRCLHHESIYGTGGLADDSQFQKMRESSWGTGLVWEYFDRKWE